MLRSSVAMLLVAALLLTLAGPALAKQIHDQNSGGIFPYGMVWPAKAAAPLPGCGCAIAVAKFVGITIVAGALTTIGSQAAMWAWNRYVVPALPQ